MPFQKKPKSKAGKEMVEGGAEYLGSLPLPNGRGRVEYFHAPKEVAGLVPGAPGAEQATYAICVTCKSIRKTDLDGRTTFQEVEDKRCFGLKFSDEVLDKLHGKRPCDFCGGPAAVVSHSGPNGPIEICRKCLDEVIPKMQADAAQTVVVAG
jgi:ribosomal protein S14